MVLQGNVKVAAVSMVGKKKVLFIKGEGSL